MRIAQEFVWYTGERGGSVKDQGRESAQKQEHETHGILWSDWRRELMMQEAKDAGWGEGREQPRAKNPGLDAIDSLES